MAQINDQALSRDASAATREFVTDMRMALRSAGTAWATGIRPFRTTNALRSTFPVNLSEAGYKRAMGEDVFRQLGQKSMSMKLEKWTDGVREQSEVIELTPWHGWGDEPAAMAEQATILPNKVIADLLKNGKTIPSWENPSNEDGSLRSTAIKFFQASHQCNVLKDGVGTYPNLHTATPLTKANVKAMKQAFREIKGPSGDPMGLRLTHILVPPDLEQAAIDIRDKDYLPMGAKTDAGNVMEQNELKGTFEIIVGDELTEPGVWYPMALNKVKTGMVPWVGETLAGGVTYTVWDKSSEHHKNTGEVKVRADLSLSAALYHPQCIKRCEPT